METDENETDSGLLQNNFVELAKFTLMAEY